jgi:hypothetical protein
VGKDHVVSAIDAVQEDTDILDRALFRMECARKQIKTRAIRDVVMPLTFRQCQGTFIAASMILPASRFAWLVLNLDEKKRLMHLKEDTSTMKNGPTGGSI